MLKRVLCVVLCLFLLMVGLSACSEDEFVPSQKPYDSSVVTNAPSEDKVIAQNSNYTLYYDSAYATVKLVDTEGNSWDLAPEQKGEQQYDDLGMPIKRNGFTLSALEVGYMDPNVKGGGNFVVTTYDNVLDGIGRIVYKEIENGVTIEYYFHEQQFMIPVDYVLTDDYLSISVDTKRIQENNNKVTYVSLAPFLCAAENDTEDSYLFYPSGSGALLDTRTIGSGGITYDAYVYGDDLTMEEQYIATNETSIRMPVYGYKSGNLGGVAIIDGAPDTALLTSTVGNRSYGFSAVYPAFQLRGYTTHISTSFNHESKTKIYPENMIEGTVSIRFYPLVGESANYTEMANIYRNYLIEEKGLTSSGDEKALSVSLLGGTMVTESFVGIPYQTLHATTTVSEAKDIIADISKNIDDFAVQLKGYGSTGVDIGKIGGGFKIGSAIGSEKELKNLSSYCNSNSIDLYMDYDVIRFSKSSSGFSTFSDVVMNCGYIKSDQYLSDIALRNNEEDLDYRLLRPIKFSSAVSKAIDNNSDWSVKGISFDTLSSLSYSDYSDYNITVDYNAKHGYSDAVSKALSQIGNKQNYMANSANDYAAVLADIIVNTPVSSDNGHAFMEDVPFYSMVFKGYVPMTCESINLAANTNKTLLGAIEGGIGLNYTIISEWDSDLINAKYPYFYSTAYSGVKDTMLSTYNDLADYYAKIDGATIVSNEIVSSGVHCTVFDNGVTVYVNYNTSAVETPVGVIEALAYSIDLGGAA